MRSATVRIDLSALRHNFRRIRALIGAKTAVMAVVKSDAYGHGLLRASQVLEQEGTDALGVAFLDEGIVLRRGGIIKPIVILCGLRGRDESREAIEHRLTPVLYDLDAAEGFAREARFRNLRLPVHIKVDTGMARLGAIGREIGELMRFVGENENIYMEGLMSHLSNADDHADDFTPLQIERFDRSLKEAQAAGMRPTASSLANSAGLLKYPSSRFNMVRPGIMLYGYACDSAFQKELRPVMNFSARVLQIKTLETGSPVSYGRTYYTRRRSTVAVIGAGYGEGLPRAMSNRGCVILGGRRVPVIGTVCMNMTMCDVTDLDRVPRPGDEAFFLGSQGRETIGADELASYADTVSYEVLCSLGQRNFREYTDEEKDRGHHN